MKRNMIRIMDRLGIEEGMRRLVGRLWKHGYETNSSCEGHPSGRYVLLRGGDGWFERNAPNWGLERAEGGECCQKEWQEEIRRYNLNPKKVIDRRKVCGQCGAGVNGYIVYRAKK